MKFVFSLASLAWKHLLRHRIRSLLTIAGGIIGYVKAGSVASIIAGAITGVLLLVAAFLLPEHRVAGLATALIISVLLAGQFVPKFFQVAYGVGAALVLGPLLFQIIVG